MKPHEMIGVMLTTVAVILLPVLGLLWKISSKWTRMDMTLVRVTDELRALVNDKDRAHTVLLEQITKDRDATNKRFEIIGDTFDKRLRWLEEHLYLYLQRRKDAA